MWQTLGVAGAAAGVVYTTDDPSVCFFYNFTTDNNNLCPVGVGRLAPTQIVYKFTVDKNKLLPPMCPH